MKAPEPLIVIWQGRQVRIRHDDPHLGPYTPRGAVIRCVEGEKEPRTWCAA